MAWKEHKQVEIARKRLLFAPLVYLLAAVTFLSCIPFSGILPPPPSPVPSLPGPLTPLAHLALEYHAAFRGVDGVTDQGS